MTDPNRPLLGEPNAPCRACGSPLAADQRYCLQCGTRRAEARLPFLEILARQAPAPAGATTTTTVTTRRGPAGFIDRMGTNAAAVAGVACLLLALGVGVLIGGLGDNGTSGAGTPQVISVGGAAPAAAVPAASSTAPGASATPGSGAATSPKSTKKKSSSAASASKPKASNKAVQNLNSTSGADYSKKSAKLPKTLGTGGKAPPIDKSKPIGGGSDVQSIG
jgi:hypothetical protein